MSTAKRYTPANKGVWNTFIAQSANATFILDRNFMDYHNDRFTDHSLMLYEKTKCIGIFPANQKNNTIFSHGGITYGGLIVLPNTPLETTDNLIKNMLTYYHKNKFKTMIYKPVPTFFHTQPFYGDIHALTLAGAKLTHVDPGFIATHAQLTPRRLRMVKKAQKNNVRIKKAPDCTLFWQNILIPRLAQKFHTAPVHSIEEIELLRKKFSEHILQYNAYLKNEIVAGVTIFLDRGVAHAQYIASSETGRNVGALDYVFWHLMTNTFKDQRYISFGTAQSASLIEWKEGFGATMHPYTTYEISL